MKTVFLVLSLVLPLGLMAETVRLGDSVSSVYEALGTPRGQMKAGERQMLYYDRGEIEIRSGAVTRLALRSAVEQEAWEAKQSAQATRIREESESRRARLILEGNELKLRTLSDPLFQTAPLSYQLAFWEDFSRRYADVPAHDQLGVLRARVNQQTAEKRLLAEQAQRLEELENRLAAAESQVIPLTTVSYRRPRHHWDYRPYNPAPITYRFYDFPLPYATSPGMPPQEPVIRGQQRSHRPGPQSPRRLPRRDDGPRF